MRYGTSKFLIKSTVRYAFFVMIRYGSKIERKYGTVQGAKYVVRKF